MRTDLPVRPTHSSFPISKCATALLCCAFVTEPLFAQTVNWANNGNDQGNMRFQDIDQITPANVNQLKPAWTFNTGVNGDANMSMEMTPIVINNVAYITTGDDDVFALNATTGKQIWHYSPTTDTPVMPLPSTLPICCHNDNRGVAVGGGLVFNARLDAKLVALNQSTGKVVWETVVDTSANGASMTLAPQYLTTSGGVAEVIVGVSGGEYGVRGHLDAYAPATGKLLWRFWTTTPATYAGNSWKTGGAPVWGTPTFDPALNMVFFSTGNADVEYTNPANGAPDYNHYYGAPRAGTNLFSASIVALDATTGELQWFFQEAHHELWDFDGPQPTVLFTWNGIAALEHTNKTGYTWILDRASGEPLIPYEEVAVPPTPAEAAFQLPWPTQPQSMIGTLAEHVAEPGTLGPGEIAAPMWTTPGPTRQVFAPLAAGGMEWPPAAYSPRTHMYYSHAKYSPSNTGIASNGGAAAGVAGALLGVKHGVYGAINTVTGAVAWTIPILTTLPTSGMTVAGDVVFFGDNTGLFYAANAATGQILWVFDAWTVPGGVGADAGAAVYMVNGVEYVLYGFGGEPGQSFELGDAVVAFALPTALAAAAAKAKAGTAEKVPAAQKSGALAQRGRVR
jgi:quinohemoprotein ethanol dehydrogenase